jgi:hypothetical protein
VEPNAAAGLVESFERLEPSPRSVPAQSVLGYRGAWLCAPDGRCWCGFAGMAWVAGRQAHREALEDVRRDEAHAFERAILSTAPPGVLPASLSPR